VDKPHSIVPQQVFPRIIFHTVSLQAAVIAAQDLLFTLIFVSLLRRPERGAQVDEIVGSYFKALGLPVEQIRCPISWRLWAEEVGKVGISMPTGGNIL
jgi:hypothetical protein